LDWFKGKSTGNHGFSYEIWGFPAKFPSNQSNESANWLENHREMEVFFARKLMALNGKISVTFDYRTVVGHNCHNI
jgi:hypothetical protein